MGSLLPPPIAAWFDARGWRPYAHQMAMVEAAVEGAHTLLMAPTGGGKTLAGFLPALIAAAGTGPIEDRLTTLYISPLKALTQDVHRNLERPIAELGLALRAETRTGDTPPPKRQRQRRQPPQMLLTTPESFALLLADGAAVALFADLKTVIIDEVHALMGSKRGDLLALGLARLAALAPGCRRVGLSATLPHVDAARAWLSPRADAKDVGLIRAPDRQPPMIDIVEPADWMPWSGHLALHALPAVYEAIRAATSTIVFVNTRAQAELVFHHLWHLNDANLPIGLHHGSLAVDQRRKVEAAMAAGRLRAVVATSSLDLGIDWAAVDLIVQIGAPKGVSRLLQRIGRSGHRLDRASRALLVPANRFEVLECRAAVDALREGTLDGEPPPTGTLDVLAQHLCGVACAGPFDADELFAEVRRAAPYAALSRADFDAVLAFVADGGYALRRYERWQRLVRGEDGRWRLASADHARRYRMNVGTIVEAVTIKVRLRGGPVLGEVEESFIQALNPGDTFLFGGERLRFEALRETTAFVSRGGDGEPKVAVYAGGRFPLSTNLASRVRTMLADPARWEGLPPPVSEWLRLQARRSRLPGPHDLLVELFPRGGKAFLVTYPFEGRNAHQTLGMLLTRRMERDGCGPLGFVANDYALALWSVGPPADVEALFGEDMLGDDLEEWMAESSVLKRTFRNVAVIAGLIDRRQPGHEKTGRQVTFNSDLIYTVLRQHDPGHVLLKATWQDAARGFIDLGRLAALLARVKGRILIQRLPRISPFAVPLMLEVGRESVYGSGIDELFDRAAQELIAEATGTAAPPCTLAAP